MTTLTPTPSSNKPITDLQALAREKAMAREISRRYAQYNISELVEHLAIELARPDTLPKHSDVELIKTQFATLKSVALSSGEQSKIEEADIQEARLQSLLQSYGERLKEIQRKRQIETEEAKTLVDQLQSKMKQADATFDALYTDFHEVYNRINQLLLEEKSARQIKTEVFALRQLLYTLPCSNVELRDADYNKHLRQKESVLNQLQGLAPTRDTSKQDRYTLTALKKEWSHIGPVAPEMEEALQAKYQAECERVLAVLELLYVEERQNRMKANERRLELIATAKEAVESLNWTAVEQVNHLAETLKSYQEEWRSLPHDSSAQRQELFESFSTVMNSFFERRKKVLFSANRQQKNVQHKEQLILRMQELLKTAPTESTKSDVESLFEEWKRIPRTQKQVDEELWNRFNSLRRSYYEGAKQVGKSKPTSPHKNDTLQQYRTLIDKITALSNNDAHVCSRDELNALQAEWKALPYMPRGEQRDRLYYDFKAQLDILYGRLRTNDQNERYEKKFSDGGDKKQIQQELDGLRRRLKQKEGELSNVETNRERMQGLLQSSLQTSMESIERKLLEEIKGIQAQIEKLGALLSK